MRVHHLAGGPSPLSRGPFEGSLAGPRGARSPHHVLLAESADGLVLVDTGHRGVVLGRLRALGFEAGDVRHVLLTSLEHDHAGALADFPDAVIHVLAAEHAAATRPGPLARLRYDREHWRHVPRWRLHVARDERWFGFPCVREALPEGVVLVPLPGPSRGHAGVAVLSEHGWVLHAGDAYLWHDEVHSSAPPSRAALAIRRQLLDADPAGRSWTRERLRVLARDPDATVLVVSSHDPFELEACAERNPPPRAHPRPAARRERPALRLVAWR